MPTDYQSLIERLEGSIHGEMYVRDLRMDAASALRSLVAENNDCKSNVDRALEVIKQFRDERDALRAENAELRFSLEREFGAGWEDMDAACVFVAHRERDAYLAERDALRQRLEAAEKDAERYRGIRDNIGATDERIDALLLKYPLDAAYRGERKP
jgi:hypothetical protein